MDADTIAVLFEGLPPVVQLGQDTILCEGDVLTLSVLADVQTNTIWQDGSTLSSIQVDHPGIYYATSTNQCGLDADSIEIQFMPTPPLVDLGPDTVLCQGEILMLFAPPASENIVWEDGSTGLFHEVETSGKYTLEVSNACGTNADEINITFDNQAVILPSADTILICPGEIIELDVSQSIPANYIWNTGSESPAISVVTPGIYSVTIITECQQEETAFVVPFNSYCHDDFYIPNIFSPNQDQINDVFQVYLSERLKVISMEGSIYDRWGNLLYGSKTIPFVWDGTFHNNLMMPGVYVYKISIRYISLGQELEEKLTGDVTLIR
jgi:gliding motility-associated-like protein